MPIYEYVCNTCEKVTELERSHLKRHDKAKCIHCKSWGTHLIMSRNSFKLEGGGWYDSDYAGKKGKGK